MPEEQNFATGKVETQAHAPKLKNSSTFYKISQASLLLEEHNYLISTLQHGPYTENYVSQNHYLWMPKKRTA